MNISMVSSLFLLQSDAFTYEFMKNIKWHKQNFGGKIFRKNTTGASTLITLWSAHRWNHHDWWYRETGKTCSSSFLFSGWVASKLLVMTDICGILRNQQKFSKWFLSIPHAATVTADNKHQINYRFPDLMAFVLLVPVFCLMSFDNDYPT